MKVRALGKHGLRLGHEYFDMKLIRKGESPNIAKLSLVNDNNNRSLLLN